MKTHRHQHLSLCTLTLVLTCLLVAGCSRFVPDGRADLSEEVPLIESGKMSVVFENGLDSGNGVRNLSGSELEDVVTAFKQATATNEEIVEIVQPQMYLQYGDDRVAFVTISSKPGVFLVNYKAYRIDPRSDSWESLVAVFQEELQRRKSR